MILLKKINYARTLLFLPREKEEKQKTWKSILLYFVLVTECRKECFHTVLRSLTKSLRTTKCVCLTIVNCENSKEINDFLQSKVLPQEMFLTFCRNEFEQSRCSEIHSKSRDKNDYIFRY